MQHHNSYRASKILKKSTLFRDHERKSSKMATKMQKKQISPEMRQNQNKIILNISNILAGNGILLTENRQKNVKIAKLLMKTDNS